LSVKINGNRGAQQEISVSTKVLKEIVPFQQESQLRSLMQKWSNWTSGVGVGQKIRLRLTVWLGIRLHQKPPTHSDSSSLCL